MTNLDSILKSRDTTLSTKVHLVKAMVFSSSHVWMWELDYKEGWAPENLCFWTMVLGKTLESPLDCKEIHPVHPKGDQSWVFIGRTDAEAETNTLATWCEELTHWKRPWCWEGLGAGGEGDDRGRDGWMASPTPWAWVWVKSRSWWWTGRPGVLSFMGLQRVRHDWATELNWTEVIKVESISTQFPTKIPPEASGHTASRLTAPWPPCCEEAWINPYTAAMWRGPNK